MSVGKNIIELSKALLVAYAVMLACMMITTLAIWKLNLSDVILKSSVILIYVLSAASAGIYIGKMKKEKKFLWGMLTGCLYFFILVILTVLSGDFTGRIGMNFVSAFFICIFSGTLGGMIA